MKINFVDVNERVIESLINRFGRNNDINFLCGDILTVANGAVVSPANSYGYMDGGIDEEYVNYFGLQLEIAVRDRLDLIGGFLPVGEAFTIPTGDSKIPYMIFAPTMEMPGEVLPRNCYNAMRAVLREIDKNNDRYDEVYCPGLGTGVGYVSSEDAAEEMYKAFIDWNRNKKANL